MRDLECFNFKDSFLHWVIGRTFYRALHVMSAENTEISGVVFGDYQSLLESMDPCGGIETVLVCPFCLF